MSVLTTALFDSSLWHALQVSTESVMSLPIEAIRLVYSQFPDAVEPILTTSELRKEFVFQVQLLCPSATEDAVLQHLVRLRKRGEEKGGLPRKAR